MTRGIHSHLSDRLYYMAWLSIEQSADYLGVSPMTVRRMIADGRLPGYRLGQRLIRIKSDDLDTVLHPIPSANFDIAAAI